MADKPILFSGPMVKAILDGRKTMTRRVIKPQPDENLPIGGACRYDDEPTWVWQNGFDGSIVAKFERNPPFAPGDRLYVREAWRTESDYYNDLAPSELSGEESILFNADADWSSNKTVGRSRPGMFLPRWASRLTLPVTNVKVERVADISEDDTKLEGWPGPSPMQEHYPADVHRDAARDWFMDLWDSINAAPKPRYAVIDGAKQITHYESYPFSGESRTETFRGKTHLITANPWVAAYTFETHHCNIDEMAG